MWEKEKMKVTSIFSFSHNVFKSILSQGCYRSGLCGKELTLSLLLINMVFNSLVGYLFPKRQNFGLDQMESICRQQI